MGPTALLPLRRKACWGFIRPKNSTDSAGCEPANLGTKGQHATSRPSKPLMNSVNNPCCLIFTASDVHVTVHRDKFPIIKPTRCTNFSNLFLEWNFTCFGQFLSPSSGIFQCTHSNGICHTGLLTACEQDQDGIFWSCSQVKNSWW